MSSSTSVSECSETKAIGHDAGSARLASGRGRDLLVGRRARSIPAARPGSGSRPAPNRRPRALRAVDHARGGRFDRARIGIAALDDRLRQAVGGEQNSRLRLDRPRWAFGQPRARSSSASAATKPGFRGIAADRLRVGAVKPACGRGCVPGGERRCRRRRRKLRIERQQHDLVRAEGRHLAAASAAAADASSACAMKTLTSSDAAERPLERPRPAPPCWRSSGEPPPILA